MRKIGAPPTTNCERTQRPDRISNETTGSPSLWVAQSPPSDWKSVLPATGPKSSSPVVLSKTAKLVLFHCTYCFAPTRPLVSGGLLEGINPASPTPTPRKFKPVGRGAETTGPKKVWMKLRVGVSVGGLGLAGSRTSRRTANSGESSASHEVAGYTLASPADDRNVDPCN